VVLPCHGDTLWPSGPSDLCGVPMVKPAGSGSTAAQTPRCEHMDLVIPLNATSHLSSAPLKERYEGRVREAVAHAHLEGWHAEDRIDWPQRGRLAASGATWAAARSTAVRLRVRNHPSRTPRAHAAH